MKVLMKLKVSPLEKRRKSKFSYIPKRHSSNKPPSHDCERDLHIHRVSALLGNVCDFLLPFLSLANGHMIHFFSHRHWESRIPSHLHAELEEIAGDENRTLMSHYFSLDPLPRGSELEHFSSLTGTLARLRSFTLPALLQLHPDFLDPHGLSHRLTNKSELPHNGVDGDNIEIKSRRLPRKCISGKKHHEVDVMGSSLLRVRELVGFNTLVDVGCGLGYLEEELRQRLRSSDMDIPECNVLRELHPPFHTLKIIGIEGNESLLRSAHARRNRLFHDSRDWKNLSVAATISRPEELTATLKEVLNESGDVHEEEPFCSPIMGARINDNNKPIDERYFLCGLHACGGLTSSTLKSFVELVSSDTRAKSFCSGFFVVGCCYHKIMERWKSSEDVFDFPLTYLEEDGPIQSVGFPLSRLLRDRDFVLGQNARMSANQPLARIQALGRKPTESPFLSAVLDVILREVFSTISPAKKMLGRKLSRFCDSEIEFLKKGLERHGFEAPPSDETLHRYLDRFGVDRGKLYTFYELRCLLGAIVETVVVLDRFLFILESGAVSEVALVQAFDPIVSPRCFALVGLTRSF